MPSSRATVPLLFSGEGRLLPQSASRDYTKGPLGPAGSVSRLQLFLGYLGLCFGAV